MGHVKDYRDIKALSQSSLKLLNSNIKKFYWEEERWLNGTITERPERKKEDHLILGDLVDILLTRPNDMFEEYHINTSPDPKPQMKSFVDEYVKLEAEHGVLSAEDARELGKKAYDLVGFKAKGDTFEKVTERFRDEGMSYYTALRSAKGKTVVEGDMYAQAIDLVAKLKEDRYTGPIVKQESGENIQVFYQMIVRCNVLGVPMKGMIDKVIVNHAKKAILPIDYKTSVDYDFANSIVKYRYDLQGSLYSHMLSIVKEDMPETKGYWLMPFGFVVASTSGKGPELWELSYDDAESARFGGETRGGRVLKGFEELIEDYKWHKEKNEWDYPRKVVEDKGVRTTSCYL